MPVRTRLVTLLGLSLFSGPAAAVERSLDTQLIYPSLQPEGGIAVASPRAAPEPWRLLLGGSWQVERMPLEYFLNGQPAGAAVASRNTLLLGGAMSFSKATTVWMRTGLVVQDPGSDEENPEELAVVAPAHNFGNTDLDLGVKSAVIRTRTFAFGPRLDIWLPIGTRDSWVAESNVRYAPGVLLEYDPGPVTLLLDTGIIARTNTDTDADFVMSSELSLGAAVLVPIKQFTVIGEVTSRHGFENFMKPGAENPIEAKGGLRMALPGGFAVDLVGGSALDNGYGAADLRILASVLRVPPPRPDAPVVEVQVAAPEQQVVELAIPEQTAVVEWQPGELAQVHHGTIVIREPIQFEFNTANILPQSRAVLKAVADVMNDYPQIEHMVVEGHASEEGSYEYNYELSNNRAQAVWRAIVESGVRPERVSFRGRGETVAIVAGTDEEALAKNRRVEFKILKVRDYLEVAEPDMSPLVIPWTGEVRAAPKMGEKLLSADAHPILVEQFIAQPAPVEQTPDASTFKPGFDDEAVPEDEKDPDSPTPPAKTEAEEE